MFSAYVENPQNCHFEGQDLNEKILLLLRAHPITNFSWIFFALIFLFIPFLVVRFIPEIFGFNLNLIPAVYLAALLIIDYLLVLIIFFEGFLYWYFNITLITDQKVIDIDFEPVLYKGVELAPLTKIEETDSTTAGIFGTFFHYGNVAVQTAGAKVAIEMRNIPKPALVADLILDLARKPHEHIGPGPGV